jgi:hypothetical protein
MDPPWDVDDVRRGIARRTEAFLWSRPATEATVKGVVSREGAEGAGHNSDVGGVAHNSNLAQRIVSISASIERLRGEAGLRFPDRLSADGATLEWGLFDKQSEEESEGLVVVKDTAREAFSEVLVSLEELMTHVTLCSPPVSGSHSHGLTMGSDSRHELAQVMVTSVKALCDVGREVLEDIPTFFRGRARFSKDHPATAPLKPDSNSVKRIGHRGEKTLKSTRGVQKLSRGRVGLARPRLAPRVTRRETHDSVAALACLNLYERITVSVGCLAVEEFVVYPLLCLVKREPAPLTSLSA